MTSIEIQKTEEYGEGNDFLEDPFDGDIDLTFPPLRYFPMHYPAPPQQKKVSMRRESSRERQRLYKELVGHEPYQPTTHQPAEKSDIFWITLDIKHYKPEEVTLKVDGQELVVSGKHYNETEDGFDSCEFQRKYTIPESIDMHTLTSNITPNGVLCIKATKDQPHEQTASVSDTSLENFNVSLDVQGYRPDEITISLHGHNLVIRGEGKPSGKDAEGTANPKKFARHFSLPSDVDVESISSRYTKDGKISVEAPRKVLKSVRTLELKEE